MKKYASRFNSVSSAFIFLLFGLFVLLSTLLVLFSLYAYQHTLTNTAAHNQERVLQSYIRSAVRAADRAGTVAVGKINDKPVLEISDIEEDETYVKYIYQDGSVLREAYLSAEEPFDSELGEEICEISSFSAELNGQLLTVRSEPLSGDPVQVSIALRAGK